MSNEIIEAIKKENGLSNELSLSIQFKLKFIKEELININYAIHWARAGIINSIILSNSEIKIATEMLEKENLPYSTPEEALNFANVKIISNNSCLLYIVYIPITTNEIYEKLLIKPIKKNNIINEPPYENVIKNEKNIFGIVNKCKTINYLSICNRNNIVDISNSTCLPNLLKSRIAKCNKINNHHIPTIEEITEGIILLNQFNGTISIENETHKLDGTFLLKFHNTSVAINERIFISREKSSTQVLPAILQPTPSEKRYKEILSLQMLKDIHINNTNKVELLETEKAIHQYISYGSISLTIIGFVIFITMKCRTKKTLKIVNTTESLEAKSSRVEGKYQDADDNLDAKNLDQKFIITASTLPRTTKEKFQETSS